MKYIIRKMALLLVIVLITPLLWNQEIAMAATTPSLTKTKLELRGLGETYDINVKNKVAKSTYTWTSSDKKVATVTKKGIVTSKGAGVTMIKCVITYPSKKTKSLTCKVTVTIPSTEIAISKLPLVNNAYQLSLGSTVDLNAVLSPSNTTDTAYWYIDKDNMLSDPTCISLDSNNQGIVTGIKAGKAVVRVKAAQAATQASADASDIDDAIIIEVIAPTATVKSVDFASSNQITAVFDSPVQKSTVINTDGTLSSNISVSLRKNTKNVLAADPGTLKGALSTDNKTLTITSTNAFDGIYMISFSSSILTTAGVALEEYNKQIVYEDTIAPYITNTAYDDTGMIATIYFSETVDFSNFSVKNATVVNSSTTVTATTLSILSNTSNYTISTDKKSISINMTNISTSDYGKLFSVTIAGIKDLSGNVPDSLTLTAYLQTDNTPKPQAQLLYVTRTGYYTLTAFFDRSIKTPGYLQIAGGSTILGVVDSTDTKKVNYTMSSAEALYTGIKQVSVGFWSGYNVISTDTSANKMVTRSVDFTVETTSPTVTSYEYDITTGILTLTYSETVSILSSSGVFTANLTTSTDDIVNGLNINYSTVTHTLGDNIIKLKLTFSSTRTGYYSFTLPQGFVKDSFSNLSVSKALIINNSSGSTELPGPYMITQSSTNRSEITVMFAYKLDVASATTISNYKISGVTILSATMSSNTTDGATVVLTVQTIDATIERPVTITGVKGYNNSYTAISSYSTTVLLKENVPPVFSGTPVYDSTSKNIIRLNFTEAVQGSLTVTVTQVLGSTSVVLSNTVTVSGNCAYITLGSVPANGSYLKITVDTNNLTDIAGNAAVFATTTLGVAASY